MNNAHLDNDAAGEDTASLSEAITGMLRFFQSVRQRFYVVVLFMVIGSGLAVVSHMTATRKYESRAELLVSKTGSNMMRSDVVESHENVTREMPTFEKMLLADEVLENTLKSLPHERLGDFHGVAPDLWVEAMRKRIFTLVVRNTNLMEVRYTSDDPEDAHAILRSLIASYLSYVNAIHRDPKQAVLDMLVVERDSREKELREAETEHLQLKSRSGLLLGSDESMSVLVARVQARNQALIAAQQETVKARSLYESVHRAYQTGEDLTPYASQLMSGSVGNRMVEAASGLASGSEATTQSRLQQKLLDDQAELEGLLQIYGPNHAAVQRIQERISLVKQQIQSRPAQLKLAMNQQMTSSIAPQLVQTARNAYEVALQHEQRVQQEFDTENSRALQLNTEMAKIQSQEFKLERMRSNYSVLQDQIQNIDFGNSGGVMVKVTNAPRIQRTPVAPLLRTALLILLLIGVGGGLTTVYLLDLIDNRFQSPEDIRMRLGVPVLAMVRKLTALTDKTGLDSIYPYAKPGSVESEAFRTLRTSIDFSSNDTAKLTISSTEPSDGKTTVMTSLGVAFAQAGKRTLLIDGDMRRPGLTKLMKLSGEPGLSTVLRDDAPMEESVQGRVQSTKLEGLDVLPAGPKPGNPAELLTTVRLSELLGWAESHYDQVLVDAPPSLAVADVQIISRLVDGAILTVRPDRNKRSMVIRAAEALTSLGCPLFGVVVNHLAANAAGDYGYGYGYGYTDYGHDEKSGKSEEVVTPPRPIAATIGRPLKQLDSAA